MAPITEAAVVTGTASELELQISETVKPPAVLEHRVDRLDKDMVSLKEAVNAIHRKLDLIYGTGRDFTPPGFSSPSSSVLF